MSLAGIALVGALALGGCSSGSRVEPDSPPAAAGTASIRQASARRVELRFDETAESGELTLRWLTVEDSRCPVDVVCIWAGQVVITLELTGGDDETVELQLVHRVGRQPTPERALDHELRVLGVEPQPREGVKPERAEWVATLEINPA